MEALADSGVAASASSHRISSALSTLVSGSKPVVSYSVLRGVSEDEDCGGAANSAERVTETDAVPEDDSRLSSIHTQHPDSSEPGRDVKRFISS